MKQTQFTAFWRSVNTLLSTAGHAPATQGPARGAWTERKNPAEAARSIIASRAAFAVPNHRRGDGKVFAA